MKGLKSCRSCGSKKLVDIISLGSQYLSDFVEIKEKKKSKKYPLDLILCEKCYLVQLRHTVPSKLLYNNHYGYRSGINQTMRDELQDVAFAAQNFVSLKKGDVVIDIGANDGTLLKNYPKGIIKVAVEPVKKFAKELENIADIVVNDFWSKEAYEKAINS